MTRIRFAGSCVLLAFATAAGAQTANTGKTLYCWNDHGQKICGDALPPGAVDLARTEISARSGMHTGQVARALTDAERAAAEQAEQQAQAAAAVEAARLRRDLAMVESYATEADLRRAYGERIALLDGALKASMLGQTNLRNSLVSLLDQAGNLELAGKPVTPTALASVRHQHAELLRQQRILAQQRADRTSLDSELADAIARYRALKHPEGSQAAANTVPADATAG